METTKQEQNKLEKRWKNEERIPQMLQEIEWEMDNLKALSNGEFMSPQLFRLALKENENLSNRWKTLQDRKFKIERLAWRLL
jgi:Zn-dependent M16 (insulinase) family peptidase